MSNYSFECQKTLEKRGIVSFFSIIILLLYIEGSLVLLADGFTACMYDE